MGRADAPAGPLTGRPGPSSAAGGDEDTVTDRGTADSLSARVLRHPVRAVLVAYAVSRLVSLLALWVAATWFQNPAGVGSLEPGLADMFGLWDAAWYERIAEDGYPVPLPVDSDNGQVTYSAWAFFPLYPYLVRAVMLTGLSFVAAGVVLNLVLGAAAAVLVWALFRSGDHADRQPQRDRLALVAACLWCFYPATAVLLKPYTEALTAVLVAGSLVLLVRRRYLWVAALAIPLGLTRGVAPAFAVAALIHLVVRWREDRGAGVVPLAGARVRALVMLGALAVGSVIWPAVAAVATGVPTAFFDVQAVWGQRPDQGPFVLWFEWAWEAHGLLGVLVLVGLVGTYVSLVLGRHGRWICVEARAWALAYPLYLFAVVRPISSMWRFLLLDLPVAALVASVTMRTANGVGIVPHWRRRVGVVIVVLCAGILWWTAALLTYTPWGSLPP